MDIFRIAKELIAIENTFEFISSWRNKIEEDEDLQEDLKRNPKNTIDYNAGITVGQYQVLCAIQEELGKQILNRQ